MYIDPLARHLAVCSLDRACRLVGYDKRFWNVISICGPLDRKADLPLANKIHYACFDDIEDPDSTSFRSARLEDITGIFSFINGLDPGPPLPPLMIHCQQGISRSAGVALSWIYGHLPPTGDRFSTAIDIILQLQPVAKPNRLVLSLGLSQFMPKDEAYALAARIVSEPRLDRNRFQQS